MTKSKMHNIDSTLQPIKFTVKSNGDISVCRQFGVSYCTRSQQTERSS